MDELRKFVKNQIGFQNDNGLIRSIALLDRSTISRAHALFSGEFVKSPDDFGLSRLTFGGELKLADDDISVENRLRPKFNPFIAISELATIVNAALFYDRIVVVHPNESVCTDLADLLGNEVEYVRLDPGSRRNNMDSSEYMMGELVQSTWGVAFGTLASTGPHLWTGTLEAQWRHLIPTLRNLPLDTADDSYSASPNQPTWPVFSHENGVWINSPEDALEELARDNTYRGYYYILLANKLAGLISDRNSPVNVRYLGSCLRTPVIIAAMRGSKSHTAPLERQLDHRKKTDSNLRMPFWLDAVMANCESASKFSTVLGELRTVAKPLRNARTELEKALHDGKTKHVRQISEALNQEVGSFAEQVTSASLNAVLVGTTIGVIPDEIGKTMKEAMPLTKLLVKPIMGQFDRVFRPHLHAVQTLSKNADSAKNSLGMAARIFDFPVSFEENQKEFVDRLGSVTWVS